MRVARTLRLAAATSILVVTCGAWAAPDQACPGRPTLTTADDVVLTIPADNPRINPYHLAGLAEASARERRMRLVVQSPDAAMAPPLGNNGTDGTGRRHMDDGSRFSELALVGVAPAEAGT